MLVSHSPARVFLLGAAYQYEGCSLDFKMNDFLSILPITERNPYHADSWLEEQQSYVDQQHVLAP